MKRANTSVMWRGIRFEYRFTGVQVCRFISVQVSRFTGRREEGKEKNYRGVRDDGEREDALFFEQEEG